MTDTQTLDAKLLAAHETGDAMALMNAYAKAAAVFEAKGDLDAAAFLNTHALVFALEAGAPEAQALEQWLQQHGRL